MILRKDSIQFTHCARSVHYCHHVWIIVCQSICYLGIGYKVEHIFALVSLALFCCTSKTSLPFALHFKKIRSFHEKQPAYRIILRTGSILNNFLFHCSFQERALKSTTHFAFLNHHRTIHYSKKATAHLAAFNPLSIAPFKVAVAM